MAKRPERPLIPHRAPATVKYEVRSEWLLGTSRVELRQLEDHQSGTVLHLATGELETVPLSYLQPVRTAQSEEAPAVVQRSPEEWERAALEEHAVRAYVEAGQTPAARAHALDVLGISERTLRDKVRRWTNDPSVAGMMSRTNGRPVGSTKANGHDRQKLISEIICEVRLSPTISANNLYQQLLHSETLDCTIPSLATIGRLLQQVRQDPRNFSGQMGREYRYDRKPIAGALTADRPLAVVEMDSTVVDVHIRHPYIDVPIGRPWLTMAIDRFSRIILGIYISLDPPGALSTALCLRNTVLPKEDWLEKIGATGCIFPGYGLMQEFYTDNGSEFKHGGLDSAFKAYGIRHTFRPPGDPAKGGIIERAIGTFMKKVRLLPGASHSDILKRAPKDVHKSASMTLQELELYVVHAVSLYHQTQHEGIYMPPVTRWMQAWNINGIKAAPKLPRDPENFAISVLPLKRVCISRGTVTISRLRFGHSGLNKLHGRHIVRYDPRDCDRVYVQTQDGFVVAEKLDPTIPSMSFYEWAEWRRRHRNAEPFNPEQLAKDLAAVRKARESQAKRGQTKPARAHARQLSHDDVRPVSTPVRIPFARALGRILRGRVDGDE